MNKQEWDEDVEMTYNLITSVEKLKWFLIGFMAGVLTCFLIQVLA